MKKQFLVIGLGRFGETIARELAEEGAEVMAVDMNEELVNHAASYATQAAMLDATDEQALDSLGVKHFDVVCICVGKVEPSILITLLCKERGVQTVISKASSDLHASVLEKVGADRTIFPERDGGVRLARTLLSSNILELIELSPEYSIAEFDVHSSWEDKSILEMDFRNKFGVNVVAIRSGPYVNINPTAKDILKEGDIIVAIGSEDQLEKLEKAARTKNN